MAGEGEYPRDMKGYGRVLPDPRWPGRARIAVQIAFNYECGGESNILHGDSASEFALTDTGFPAYEGKRSVLVESSFEYGSRRGCWRILNILKERNVQASIFAVGMAIERNPEFAVAAVEEGHEIVGHGHRWIDYQVVPEDLEREYMKRAVNAIERITGKRPVGWMTGRPSVNTRRLIVEEGGFIYDRESLNDELPYWVEVDGKPHLSIPYSYETNDKRCNDVAGFVTSEDFFVYMKDAFDVLYAEGEREPKILTVAVHDRIMGRPGRAAGFARFLDYILEHERVWTATGEQIARHWIETFPYHSSPSS